MQIELPIWAIVAVFILCMIGVGTMITAIVALFLKPFEIDDTLKRLDNGQDDELDLLEEIHDALTKKKD